MREEPIQETHCLSYSKFVDIQIATKIDFPTPLGIPLQLWFNKNGNVVGVHYYREPEP